MRASFLLIIIDLDHGLSPNNQQPIILTSADLPLFGDWGTISFQLIFQGGNSLWQICLQMAAEEVDGRLS